MKRKQYAVSIKLDQLLIDRMQMVASRLGISPTELVRMLIELASDKEKKVRRRLGKTVKQLTVQVGFDMYVKVRRMAKEQERSSASVTRRLIRDAVEKRRKTK